jgi:hypothetical protein
VNRRGNYLKRIRITRFTKLAYSAENEGMKVEHVRRDISILDCNVKGSKFWEDTMMLK